tara:strand:+ start:750 stop:1154 length:405 start_codon:yes stop_codon:yes gene_type:complete
MKKSTIINFYDTLFIIIIIIYIPLLLYTIFSKYNFLSYVKKEYTKITFDLYVSIFIIILLSGIFLFDLFSIIHTDLKGFSRFREAYKEAIVAVIIALFARLDLIAPVFIVIFFFLYYMHDGKTDEIKSKKHNKT